MLEKQKKKAAYTKTLSMFEFDFTEFYQEDEANLDNQLSKYCPIIDKVLYKSSKYYPDTKHLSIREPHLWKKVINEESSNLCNIFSILDYVEYSDEDQTFIAKYQIELLNNDFTFEIKFTVNPLKWSKLYSPIDVIYNLVEGLQQTLYSGLSLKVEDTTLILDRTYEHDTLKIDYVYTYWNNWFVKTMIKIIRNLENRTESGINITFNFPPAIKTACKQYLIYFGEFLSQLGLPAETSVQEVNGKTMLQVVPEDKEHALELINEALNVYLRAPGNPGFKSEPANDLNLMQWKYQVMQLEGQIMLKDSILQAKDKTIEALELTNYLLSEQPVQQVIQIHEASKKSVADPEPIFNGLASLKSMDLKAGEIHFGEMIRRLKGLFRKMKKNN
jgi:hypothetical protein